jgi:hypothetical protein
MEVRMSATTVRTTTAPAPTTPAGVRNVSKEQVMTILERFIPGAKYAVPDRIAEAAGAANVDIPWARFPTTDAIDPFWDMSAERVLDIVFPLGRRPDGDVLVVTDELYPRALLLQAANLLPHLRANAGWLGGDLVILIPRQRRIVLIHHMGAYAHIQA